MGVVLVDDDGTPVAESDTWPCHAEAEQLFSLCSTQWTRRPMLLSNGVGGVAMESALDGLDYPGVEAAARMARITITPELFDDLQTIERGAMGMTIESPPELDRFPILHIEFIEHEQNDTHRHPDHR